MASEELIERLLNVFQDLKKNLESRPTGWEEHITQAELSCLREIFSERRNAVGECLADIDQQISIGGRAYCAARRIARR
jgi:hypothetical protein